jgi:iron complex outermembrane receptor protein
MLLATRVQAARGVANRAIPHLVAAALRGLAAASLLASLGPIPRAFADTERPDTPAPSPAPARDLTELSLADLASMQVTSVSKTPEERAKTPAAIYVITQEDIRRSGATTLPEILRLAPGVEVARIDSDHWSVGVRGFGDQFSKSVLVLLDGRNLYTPLFAGVLWSIQDTALEDIDRIEVIRGPGGTVWGANAVNGVINVITKSAQRTHGVLASAAGGSLDQGIATFRYGGGNDKGFDYRAYGKIFSRGPESHTDGKHFDDWHGVQFGARTDWTPREGDTVTVQGDAYDGRDGQRIGIASFSPPAQTIVDEPLDVSGQNLLARWARKLKKGDLQVETYYDRTALSGPQLEETRNTFDVDFVHHLTLPGAQDFVWGLGARLSPSTVVQTVPTLDVDPHRRTTSIYSAFVQDEIPLVREKLALTLGSKLEHNDSTGFEIQPSARLLWTLRSHQTLWTAVTRAVRTPSRLEQDLRLTGFLSASPLLFLEIDGDRDFDSEELVAYEVGYRGLVLPRLYLDVALFRNAYDRLESFGAGTVTADAAPEPAHVTLHFPYANGVKGNTDGAEVALDGRPAKWWQLKASYSYLSFALENVPGNIDTSAVAGYEGSSPKHMGTLQSRLDLPKGFEFDQIYRYVGALPARHVEAYSSLDLRLGWHFARGFEASLVGQNLLQPRHAEFEHDPGVIISVRRSAYAQVTWRR